MLWRTMPGLSNYEISDAGHARRVGSAKPLATQTVNGYRCIALPNDAGRRTFVRLNRMVLLAFAGEPPTPDHHAAHQNGDRSDDRLENLRWMTSAENIAQKAEHGTRQVGETGSNASLRNEDVMFIRENYSGRHKEFGSRPLAKRFGVSVFAINCALYGRTFADLPNVRPKPGRGCVSRPAAAFSERAP